MLRVGLTGGMGSGKSTVARLLAECGAIIVDSDVIAREVVAPGTPGLAALVVAFGSDILAEDGSLNRPALAAKAFADDTSRSTLNSITHPLVGVRTAELIAAAPSDAVVVQDIPLLIENGLAPMFNLVIAVHADLEVRLARLVEHRGVDESDARARIAAQATDDQRRAVADVLVDNGGALGAIDAEVRRLYGQRLIPFERNAREGKRVGANYWLVPCDSQWPAQAQRLIARLNFVCGADALHIDHIGSTAVPGLDAKDVIDLQVTVPDIETADRLADRLADAGFPRLAHVTADKPLRALADVDADAWAKRLHASADPGRPAHIHLRVDGSPGQRFALAFRDWLREDADARAEYLALKREAEAKATGLHGHAAAVAYLSVKDPWFNEVSPRVPLS